MTLYRAARSYSNGTFTLTPGHVVDLDDDTAAQVERDSPGALVPLSDEEVSVLDEAFADTARRTGIPVRPDWRPAPAQPHVARGGGEAMHSGNMWGGPR